jgi:hypothetical protein
MSNSSGKYAVPEEILKFKPRGTMVKKIHGGFYVYAMENVKNPVTGKWQTKSKGIMGKITVENGYVPNEDIGYTVLEYGAYHLAEECSTEIKAQFLEAFGRDDNAKRIWVLALIYSVNGFRPISAISLLYKKSSLAVAYPSLKMGETAVSNILEHLGRRDTESKKFQDLLLKCVKEIAIDGHVIPRYSKLDGMTEYYVPQFKVETYDNEDSEVTDKKELKKWEDCRNALCDIIWEFMYTHKSDIPNDWNRFHFGLDDLEPSCQAGQWVCFSDGYLDLDCINSNDNGCDTFVECM